MYKILFVIVYNIYIINNNFHIKFLCQKLLYILIISIYNNLKLNDIYIMNKKSLKLFETESEFKTQELDLSNPTVAYTEETLKTYIRPRCSIRLVYDIQDTVNQETQIFDGVNGEYAFRVIQMSVDGVNLNEPLKSYTFTTTGQHIIRATFEYTSKVNNYLLHILDVTDSNNELVEIKFEDRYSKGVDVLNLSDTGLYNGFNLNKVTKIDMMYLPFDYSNITSGATVYFSFDTSLFPNLETLVMPKNLGTTNAVYMPTMNFNGTVFLPKNSDYLGNLTTSIDKIWPNAVKYYYDQDGNIDI